ncbi:MAG: hypothetical protein KBC84_11190 [Proteobacteria bacterium]|nr:hypothetical protein [Pseudomonadota bacterium]
MAANSGQKITVDAFLKFKRYMSILSLICIFLVIVGGLNSGVSIETITLRSMIVLLCLFAMELVLVKTWNAWQMQTPSKVKTKARKK